MKIYRTIATAFAIAFAIVVAITCWAIIASAATSSVTLAWDANTEADLAGYKLYRATTAGGPYTLAQTVGKVTTTTLTGVVDGTHYFVLTAFDNKTPTPNESGHSNQVTFGADTTPPANPKNVVITITVTVP